jgi:hypothetical protein
LFPLDFTLGNDHGWCRSVSPISVSQAGDVVDRKGIEGSAGGAAAQALAVEA